MVWLINAFLNSKKESHIFKYSYASHQNIYHLQKLVFNTIFVNIKIFFHYVYFCLTEDPDSECSWCWWAIYWTHIFLQPGPWRNLPQQLHHSGQWRYKKKKRVNIKLRMSRVSLRILSGLFVVFCFTLNLLQCCGFILNHNVESTRLNDLLNPEEHIYISTPLASAIFSRGLLGNLRWLISPPHIHVGLHLNLLRSYLGHFYSSKRLLWQSLASVFS